MKKSIVILGMLALLAVSSTASAAEIITADGVLSIETPGDEWKEKADPNYWFTISDGKNTITIDHLSNGETLPSVDVAGNENGAVYQAFVSTRNEVFVVKGLAASQEDLADVMKTIGTVKVLKYDTKTAVQKEEKPAESAQTAGTGQFGIRQINATYYVVTDELNVRDGYSTDAAVLGALYRDEPVQVTGAVTKDGADFGWYQIQYNGAVGYVASGFLSASESAGKTSENEQPESGSMEQCQYCGEWFVVGDEYREHLLAHSMENLEESHEGMEQCQYCGEWFVVGDEYREHLLSHSMENLDESHEGMEQCQYCGEWFVVGDEYRDHLLGHSMEGIQPGA